MFSFKIKLRVRDNVQCLKNHSNSLENEFSNDVSRVGNKQIVLYEVTRLFGLLGLGKSMIVDNFHIKGQYESLIMELKM